MWLLAPSRLQAVFTRGLTGQRRVPCGLPAPDLSANLPEGHSPASVHLRHNRGRQDLPGSCGRLPRCLIIGT